MKDNQDKNKEVLRQEYDLDYSKAVRGKYFKRLMEKGSNIIVLEPDIAKEFHDSDSVNKALRSLLEITRTTQRLTSRTGSSGRQIRSSTPE